MFVGDTYILEKGIIVAIFKGVKVRCFGFSRSDIILPIASSFNASLALLYTMSCHLKVDQILRELSSARCKQNRFP
jgi:hypothetical protein